MVRRFISGKWEATLFVGLLLLLLFALQYVGWTVIQHRDLDRNSWLGWSGGLLALGMALAYMYGRRRQVRIDQLQESMKQAAAGNWSSRLPYMPSGEFADLFRDYNGMMNSLEDRMKLLQKLGEKEAEEAVSREAAVLEERRRLARDLHDSVSQQLFALHMSSSSLPMLLDRNPEQAKLVMNQLIEMSSTAQKQMRGLIAQLRPLELQGRTLPEALDRWFPDFCRQNGLQGTLDIALDSRLSDAKEGQMFLIIQEAMGNVVKHSAARSVTLRIGESASRVTLQIEDDGQGFRVDNVREGSHGLSTMRERALKLGGEANIVTKQGSGTRVKVWVPKFEPVGSEGMEEA